MQKFQMKYVLTTLFVCLMLAGQSQWPDHIYKPNIHSIKLFKYGDVYSYPVLNLGSNDQIELHFDDLDGDIKNYYYTFQLCNADWNPANIQAFDYIKGFQSNRISNYRISSIIPTRYTHYQAVLPERSMVPTRSGNYLLKVYLNSDTSKLAFTKRFLVVNNRMAVSAQVMQPYNGHLGRTHQRVQVNVNTANAQINSISPQDIKVAIVQNYIWQEASIIDRPTIFRGNYYEYSDESNTTFAAGKEWRWVNLRSFRLRSDRVQQIVDTSKTRTDIYVKPDAERYNQVYIYMPDINGLYTLQNDDGTNPYWQSDYAWVHFSFIPPSNRAFEGRSIYLFGELTNYDLNVDSKMLFNEEKGVYEKSIFLKQGYYNYSYVTLTDKKEAGVSPSFENTEGNYWGADNAYMIMVYYRPFGARADELLGFTRVNSVFQR
ncbi:MAG TPA: DUF5103 domain-containing protein [Chitinophagaceae bacterium]|nr:DUF5103 domain-containing protein [Chitinophagaceae bacterium]HNL60069.1 DUF5103 domain-containing protein [Chitinophagaceae bacterium]HNN99789.1 DUF5103 domain-containing protein [Chitinophagaceae bacterium]